MEVDKIFSLYCEGKLTKHNELFLACQKDPYVYGSLIQKIQLQKNGHPRVLSSGSDASTTSCSGQVDSEEPPAIPEVRPRSRQTICEQGESPKKQPRKRVRKAVQFQSDRTGQSQEVVPRHRCRDYTEKGSRCLQFIWLTTKHLIVCLALRSFSLYTNWRKGSHC